MKHGTTTLTFLDLIFSLLGATTILTVILSITVGRSQHKLKKDYVSITVRWKALENDAAWTCSLSRGAESPPWTYQQGPPRDIKIEAGKVYESVFYRAPLEAGAWKVTCKAKDAIVEGLILVETKRGPQNVGSTAESFTFETADGS